MKISGLEDFGITPSDLSNHYATTKFQIKISFTYYPDVEGLKVYPVEQRRVLLGQYYRDQLKVVKANYPTRDYQIEGTRRIPRGITGQLTGQQLSELESNQQIKWLSVEQVEGLEKIEKPSIPEPDACPLPMYYSVQGLFVAQFDDLDINSGVQLTEERVVLVKAMDQDEAKKKAQTEFDKYSEWEYFTSSHHFVKWKFLKILDMYDVGVSGIDPEGTEIYSIWKRRKLKESDYKNKLYL